MSMGSKLLDTALLLDSVITLFGTIIIGYSYYMPMNTAKSVEGCPLVLTFIITFITSILLVNCVEVIQR